MSSRTPARRRILVIEDNYLVAQSLKDILDIAELDCTLVSTGAAALEALAVEEYASAILDYQLPDMFGVALYREITALRPALQLILVTGNSLENVLAEVGFGCGLSLLRASDVTRDLQAALEEVGPFGMVGVGLSANDSSEELVTSLQEIGLHPCVITTASIPDAVKDPSSNLVVLDLPGPVLAAMSVRQMLHEQGVRKPCLLLFRASGFGAEEPFSWSSCAGLLLKPARPRLLLHVLNK